MAISSYSELKTAISEWCDRDDLTDAKLADFVSLAEATFNRELDVVETDVTLTGTLGSRRIDISALSMVEPVALFLVDSNAGREWEIKPQADGQFPYDTSNGIPTLYALDGENIDFDCPLDSAYSFRFRYRGKYALSDAAPSNKLLEDHPDVYLAGAIVWSGLFTQDDARTQTFASLLENFMRSARHTLAQNRRGTPLVDSALTRARPGSYGW